MNRTHLTSSTLLITVIVAASATLFAVEETEKASADAVVKGNTTFALKMYQELSAKEGNLFFSPYSISSALGMTYAGARGNTEEEMKSAMCFAPVQDALHAAFKAMNAELAANAIEGEHKLNIANGLCLTGGDVSEAFKALLKDNYDAELFKGDLSAINGWVKTKTEGKIEEILKELSPNSVCVLLNAIYFKGTWASQFKKEHTREQSFKLSATNQVKTPLMYQEGKFKLLEQKGFQAAALPYKGGKLSMIVLLPDAIDGLPALEKQLTTESLAIWLAALDESRDRTIRLQLPKFKLETDYDLVPPCQNLGMKDAFLGGVADFTGMGWPKGQLWISQIKHKAFCEVNEEGTEAAAATAVEIQKTSAPIYPTFRADHPFLYLIRDNETGSILFMGRMVDPSNG